MSAIASVDGSPYETLAKRIVSSLASNELPRPEVGVVEIALEFFDSQCFDYAGRLMAPPPPQDWVQVLWSPLAGALDIDEFESWLAPTRVDALGYILEAIDKAAVITSGCRVLADGTIHIDTAQGVLVSMRNAVIEPERAESRWLRGLFEKVHQYGDDEKVAASLRRVPGLQRLQAAERTPQRAGPRGPSLAMSPTGLAWSMKKLLAASGVKAKHAQILEITAHAFGASSWNHFIAHDARSTFCERPFEMVVQDANGATHERRFFHSQFDALAAFGLACGRINAATPLQVVGASSSATYGSLYCEATEVEPRRQETKELANANSPFATPRVYMGAPNYAEADDPYSAVAMHILSNPSLAEQRLNDAMGVKEEPETRRMNSLQRRGFDPRLMRRVGPYVLLLRQLGDADSRYVVVEEDSMTGSARTVGQAACYKATLSEAPGGGWLLLADYRRRVEAVFPGMTAKEAVALGRLYNIEVETGRVSFGSVENLRTKMINAGVPDSEDLRSIKSFEVYESFADLYQEAVNVLQSSAYTDVRIEGAFTVFNDPPMHPRVVFDAQCKEGLRALDSHRFHQSAYITHMLARAAGLYNAGFLCPTPCYQDLGEN